MPSWKVLGNSRETGELIQLVLDAPSEREIVLQVGKSLVLQSVTPLIPSQPAWRDWVRRHPVESSLLVVLIGLILVAVVGFGGYAARTTAPRGEMIDSPSDPPVATSPPTPTQARAERPRIIQLGADQTLSACGRYRTETLAANGTQARQMTFDDGSSVLCFGPDHAMTCVAFYLPDEGGRGQINAAMALRLGIWFGNIMGPNQKELLRWTITQLEKVQGDSSLVFHQQTDGRIITVAKLGNNFLVTIRPAD